MSENPTPLPNPVPNPSVPTPPPSGTAAPIPASQESVQPKPIAATPPETALISIDDFSKVKLSTAEVISAIPHPKADRLLILQVKIGDRTKQIVSGIRQYYTPEQMVGKTIVVVDNLQPTKLRGEESFGMLLAVRVPDGLRLVTTDGPAPSGLPVS